MPDIPENLLAIFHATLEEQGDRYVIEVPKNEVSTGTVNQNHAYRIALLPTVESTSSSDDQKLSHEEPEQLEPPVSEGEERTVDIDNIGDQGDGIALVDRGFVVVVPDTEKGERVTIRITDVTPTVAFAEVLSREDYYE